MKKFKFLIAIFPLLVLLGCSVKEKRDGCPCRLFLDMTSLDMVDQSPFELHVLSDDGFEYKAVLDVENFKDTCVVDVPRTGLDVMVWSGGSSFMDENGLTIPFGRDCPPVYIYSARLEADGESIYDVVKLRKNYCLLSISIEQPDAVISLTVRGGVSGFDKLGKPSGGEFSVYSDVAHKSHPSISFCLPRQNEAPIYLDVTESDGRIRTFPLHDYIAEFGYDWSKPDLNDLNMILNFTPVGVTITIKSWEEELIIDVVI